MSDARTRYDLDDLLTLMAVLRDPAQGCPWDVKQDWQSIVPHTLEEAYEVADAIERRAFDELPGELGDLLFQVVYYSQFAREEQRFDFHDVVDTVTAKMVARHPHVFPEGTLASRRPAGVPAEEVETTDVKTRWEALKARERETREAVSVLDDVPASLPALSRGTKLSKRAARVGFDWPDDQGVFAKVREELAEVEEAVRDGDAAHVREEIGDLLFAVTNLARRFDIDPEQALRHANLKFERRFRHVEQALSARAGGLEAASLDEMERHWQAAKESETSNA
ncbi:nucleoside triphosphate pyrophosphohydrolase [Chromohalobacter israelensis]|uniref:Nucleoside triphosphate pyrophosphohydrolase n=1 Tax=Chromohalobacter israelensis (strain ATCC BAA-138 / DSM 3043 / CIP 106854 / NCIMB 13768 / 1H11) TaxID=290398 RepID=Q1QX16_CHRI1|nr:nucleoside triphosphate pyrophosphohydrolase [Chromohalobacter salexigens]ABE58992.1 MazG family protein [Chromohalobacter salexigens DSM 3043]